MPLDTTTQFDPFAAAGWTPATAAASPATAAVPTPNPGPAYGWLQNLGTPFESAVAADGRLVYRKVGETGNGSFGTPPTNADPGPQSAAPLPAAAAPQPTVRLSPSGAPSTQAPPVQSELVVTAPGAGGAAQPSAPIGAAGFARAAFPDTIAGATPIAPVAPAGLAAAPGTSPTDPFAAAGLVPAPSPAPTAPPPPTRTAETLPPHPPELEGHPVLQNIYDATNMLSNALATANHASGEAQQSLVHGMTFGADEVLGPIIPALIHSIATGAPFGDAYDAAVQQMRQRRTDFESEHPYVGTGLEIAGGVPTTALAGPMFGTAMKGAPLAMRAVNYARNVLAGSALGGATSFGMTDGDLQQRIQGAESGAELGGALSVVAPAVGAVARSAARAIRPTAQVPNVVGNILNEAAGVGPAGWGGAIPPMQTAAVPGFPLDVGAASNNAGLAALTRLRSTENPGAAVAQTTAQNNAIRSGATAMQQNNVQLANAMPTTDASANLVRGMQGAHDVINQEEQRMWTRPALVAQRPLMPTLKANVARSIAALPARFQAAIEKNPDLKSALADLYALPDDSGLVDVNAVRSDLLGLERTLPYDQRFAKKVAGEAAKAIMDAIESDPALRTNPKAWADYLAARTFTARKWNVLGHDVFQNMLRTNRYGQQGVDERTAASRLFGFADKSAGERVPQGISKITDMLDGIRRQWGALRTGGVTSADSFDPATAFSARASLAQGARDFIINTMLDSASSVVRDTTGTQQTLLNRLSDWIDTNRPWITRSGIFNADQLALLDGIRDAAIKGARTESLRGGSNSATYERFAGKRWLDVFMSPLIAQGASAAAGAALMGTVGHFVGDVPLGILLGMEAGGAVSGAALMQRIYAAPREAVIKMLDEAIRNPAIAHDLMTQATANGAGRISPQTRAWARAFVAMEPPAQAARAFSPAAPGGQQ